MKQSPCLLFDFIDWKGEMNPLYFSNPVKIIEAYRVEEVMPCLQEVQNAVQAGYYAAGYLSYEAAPAFEPSFQVKKGSKMPLLWFGIFREPADEFIKSKPLPFSVSEWKSEINEQQYQTKISMIKQAIENGKTYQVNFTNRLTSRFEGEDFAFYQQLSEAQSSNYSAYLQIGDYSILSASPELFFKWNGRDLITKPMKGTIKRGLTLKEDQELADLLYHSEKNRAENLMIVDLLRNDLGNIAEPGSVQVDQLFEIEQYPTVWQMTSTVKARTVEETDLVDIFQALFPCGSITGAPKISTMQMIYELEESPREVYCGAIGYITPKHEAIFNVPIRTVVIDHQTKIATYGVGGGITWDSTSDDEFQEMITKAKLLTTKRPAFDLLESLKLKDGEYFLLDRHLKRINNSAKYFNYGLNVNQVLKILEKYADEHQGENMKVRLLVSKDGKMTISGESIVPTPKDLKVSLSSFPINSKNPFLYHKTTNRSMYTEHKQLYPNSFDVLLWNHHGEITEFTNGNVVVQLDGQKWTPPQECGLLAGTFREELLDKGEIQERIITREELESVTDLWLINSVRGWVRVYLD